MGRNQSLDFNFARACIDRHCSKVSAEGKAQLGREFESLDPFALREGIERKLRTIFRLVREQDQTTEGPLPAA